MKEQLQYPNDVAPSKLPKNWEHDPYYSSLVEVSKANGGAVSATVTLCTEVELDGAARGEAAEAVINRMLYDIQRDVRPVLEAHFKKRGL